jgi:hypothetical protein
MSGSDLSVPVLADISLGPVLQDRGLSDPVPGTILSGDPRALGPLRSLSMIEVNQPGTGPAMHETPRFVDKSALLVEKFPVSVEILVKTSNTLKTRPE